MSATRDLVLVLVLGSLMQAAHGYAPDDAPHLVGSSVVLAMGFVLLTSWLAGRLFASIGLPKLTGYLVSGIVVGPACLGYLGDAVLDQLKLVNGIAVSLIALTAGSELDLRSLRPLMRTILTISFITGVVGAMIVGVVAWSVRSTIPFLAALPSGASIAVAVVLGVTIVAGSPAVVVAIRRETGADGPVARTTLGAVLVRDFIVITLYAISSTVAQATITGEADLSATASKVLWELVGSPVVGIVVGMVLSLYVKKVRAGTDYFVVAVCVAIAEVGARIGLDPLLVALAAGAFVQNVTRAGKELIEGFDQASVPVYVLFFTVAGATLHLDSIAELALPAGVLIATRAIVMLVGAHTAASLADAPPTVRRYAGFGLLPQAGLALVLGVSLTRTFPGFGPQATSLVLAIVAVNELVAPVLYRWSLVRSGEVVTDELGNLPSFERDVVSPDADTMISPDADR